MSTLLTNVNGGGTFNLKKIITYVNGGGYYRFKLKNNNTYNIKGN